MWLVVTFFEVECCWNDLQETSLFCCNTPGEQTNIKNPTAASWQEGAGHWRLGTSITSKTSNAVAAWGGIFVYRYFFFFTERKHLWYIYRRKLIAKDKLPKCVCVWGGESKSNWRGNCDNSTTKLPPSSPVSLGLIRRRWMKKILNYIL